MIRTRRERTLRRLGRLIVPLLLLAAGPASLDAEFRDAAPPGWIVEEERETSYAWIRFSKSLELDGEDYRDASITLYRIEVDIDPLTAGEELAGKKVEGQAVTRRADVGRNLGGVLWQGFEADYRAESGAVRHEEYLFTGIEGGPLYVFWARGPAASWEADAQLRQRSLEKVAAKLGAERSDPEEVEEKR